MVLLILFIIVFITIILSDLQYCGYYSYAHPIEREETKEADGIVLSIYHTSSNSNCSYRLLSLCILHFDCPLHVKAIDSYVYIILSLTF